MLDTNHFEISEIDRDISKNGILRSAVKLPSIKYYSRHALYMEILVKFMYYMYIIIYL